MKLHVIIMVKQKQTLLKKKFSSAVIVDMMCIQYG